MIEVVSTVSSFNINVEQLHSDGVQLIISTVGLDVEFPVVRVSPMLSSEDCDVLAPLVAELATDVSHVVVATKA